jgi:DNA-directed RNA polymerase subunit delta
MTDLKQLSFIEAAEAIMRGNKEPMTFLELFKLLAEAKELTDADRARMISQFYSDFITSAKFIYMGDDRWDLKSRQSIDLWDKDAYYQDPVEPEEEDEELESDEEETEADEEAELGEETEEEVEHEAAEEEDEFEEEEEELQLEEDTNFDDDKYNEYMDDYEDMYDE